MLVYHPTLSEINLHFRKQRCTLKRLYRKKMTLPEEGQFVSQAQPGLGHHAEKD
jgi:hypothetical protein